LQVFAAFILFCCGCASGFFFFISLFSFTFMLPLYMVNKDYQNGIGSGHHAFC